MRLPVTSNSQLFGLILMIMAILSGPWILDALPLYNRSDFYLATDQHLGSYPCFPWWHQQIYQEKSDLDVALIGSSYLWLGLKTPTLKNIFEEELHRPVNIVTLGYRFQGQDLAYILTKDLLQHRKVKMIVTYMPMVDQVSEYPHTQLYQFMNLYLDRELLSAAGPLQFFSIWGSSILGLPRHVVSFFRHEHPVPSTLEPTFGFSPERLSHQTKTHTIALTPPPLPAEKLIFDPIKNPDWDFKGPNLNSYQLNVAKKYVQLCRSYGVKLVLLNIPRDREKRSRPIERMNWNEVLGPDLFLVGAPTENLFAGLSKEDLNDLYSDSHLNVDGAEIVAKAVAPALLKVYQGIP